MRCRKEGTFHRHASPLYWSFANVVREERPRKYGLVPVERWARAVVCECLASFVNWVEVGRAMAKRLRHKGVVTIVPFAGGKSFFFCRNIRGSFLTT